MENAITPTPDGSDVQTMLVQISARLDRLETSLATLTDVVAQAPGLVATVADTADEYVRRAQDRGIDVDARLEESVHLVERVTKPETLRALSSIVDRLEALEPAIDAAAQAPGVGAMAADMFDEWVERAQARGVDVDARARALLNLSEKVTEPQTLASLEGLVDAVADAPGLVAMVTDILDGWAVGAVNRGIDFQARGIALAKLTEKATEPETLAALGTLIERAPELAPLMDAVGDAPGLVAMATDILDAWAVHAVERGIDFQARGEAVGGLILEATRPETVEVLHKLVHRADRLLPVIDILDEAPGLVSMVADIADEYFVKQIAAGVDVNEMARTAVHGAIRLGQFVLSEEFSALLDSGLLEPEAVRIVGQAGRALADVSSEDTGTPGIVGLLARGRHTDVRRTLSFGLRFTERFGELMHHRRTRRLESAAE